MLKLDCTHCQLDFKLLFALFWPFLGPLPVKNYLLRDNIPVPVNRNRNLKNAGIFRLTKTKPVCRSNSNGNCTSHSGFIFIPLKFEGEGYCNASAPLPNHQRIWRGAPLLIS